MSRWYRERDLLPGRIERIIPQTSSLNASARLIMSDAGWPAGGSQAVPGDAAHPMTPNLGQGGCQALEDAAVLARLAASPDPGAVPRLLGRYTAARLPRTTQVTRWSHRAASMTTWTAAPAIAIRDTITLALGKLPASAALRGLAAVYDWQPPASA